jgi:hypothetical protein
MITASLNELLSTESSQPVTVAQHNHAEDNLQGAAYFALCLVTPGALPEHLLLVPDAHEFSVIPSQLWRKVLFKLLPSVSNIDLVDYKKLAQVTVGELRSERIVKTLRNLHDSFWQQQES